ncbi:acyltransferase family protein [Massilia sp.]|uniref:acyltransferase family protein n=1 Tax=Massilia sp. TaxID=1882437 RepID=UPI00391DD0DE
MMPSPTLVESNESDVVKPVAASAITPSLSRNFSFAKVMAILTVVTGHWYTGTILWIPVTFGLLVFAFSSVYFTSAIYGERVDRERFWRKKIERLGLRFWVVMLFIVVLEGMRGNTIWHWHSLVHLAGLSGVLNWMHVKNESVLGNGLWFFTLLLLFYLSYPYLAQAARTKRSAAVLLGGGVILAVYLAENIKVGHELWLTAYAFVAGVAWGAHRPRLPATWALALTLSLWGALLVLNLMGIKLLNTVLLAAGGLSVAVWLTVVQLPQWSVIDHIAVLDRYVLEIFLVHMCLFIKPTGHWIADFLLSLCLIVVVSVVLGRLADRLSARVFRERRGDRQAA